MARKQSPQTFEKRARERDKQAKRIAKQAERSAKSAARQQQRHEDLVASYGHKPTPRPAPQAPVAAPLTVPVQKAVVVEAPSQPAPLAPSAPSIDAQKQKP